MIDKFYTAQKLIDERADKPTEIDVFNALADVGATADDMDEMLQFFNVNAVRMGLPDISPEMLYYRYREYLRVIERKRREAATRQQIERLRQEFNNACDRLGELPEITDTVELQSLSEISEKISRTACVTDVVDLSSVEPIRLGDWLEKDPPTLDFVLPGMIAGTVGNVVSPGATGKSMYALQLGIQIAGGFDILGIGEHEQGGVVYLPAEDPAPPVMWRIRNFGNVAGDLLRKSQLRDADKNIHIIPIIGMLPDITKQHWMDEILRFVDGKRLLLLDTLRRFHLYDENNSGAMAEVVARFEQIAAKTGCSVLYLHHTSKAAAINGEIDTQQAARGSSVLVDNIRWASYMRGMSEDEAKEKGITDPNARRYYVQFGVSKVNYGPPLPELWYKRHEGGILLPDRYLNEVGEKVDSKRTKDVDLGSRMV